MFCQYYLVRIKKEKAWFVTAAFKSFDHIAFDRTIDKESSTFEFFVAPESEATFLEIIAYFQSVDLVSTCTKTENRLQFNDFV